MYADESGLARIESYLAWSAEVEEACRLAARFTEKLPWLTGAQREEVERVYIADRTAASRQMMLRIGERAIELRGEYSARYQCLRRRCLAVVVTGCSLAIGVSLAVVFLAL